MSGNWGNVQQGLVSGFEVGQKTGGKLSGLGVVLSKVADRLKESRQSGEALDQKKNLLGFEGLLKNQITPAEQGATGTVDVPGMGPMKQVEQTTAVIDPTSGAIIYKIPGKGGSKFQPQAPPEITKTTALGIISDPVKAEQLKQTYPDVYSLVESVARGESSGSAGTPIGMGNAGNQNTAFNSVQEAEAAGLPSGTMVTIGGRPARIK